MSTQPEFIAGIYNFCDAWCERCLFTSRCRSFQLQTATGLASPQNSGDALVQQLTEALSLTKKYVENLTRSHELFDSNAPITDQIQALEANASGLDPTQQQSISTVAGEYLRQTGIWLSVEKDLLEQAGQRQIQEVELGLKTQEEAMPGLHALKDAWEMIRWYRTLIPVKTQSVLRSMTDIAETPKLTDYFLGKVKLILVSIDRSILAWQTIMGHFPEKIDDLLDSMALLSRLRRELESLFPNARAFNRPGLD
ncbi:hypothetical protein WBJ53_01870 [Spirosoma sp. SC4-14]|uniref:hypothetical protein n=1 Tax=Spirosoma sp. SC4-14 TaxID=3128900 RepID=UPI0030D1DE31